MKIECGICKEKFDNLRKLSKHIRDNHPISIKEYYDTYCKKNNDGICIMCGKYTKWRSIGEGYMLTCGHKCGCKYHRNNLKNNLNKMNLFVNKVKENQTRIWQNREINGNKNKIFKKISIKNKSNNSKMSKEERKIRFGWLNKLSPSEREFQIKKILEKSLFKFYRNASPEEKQRVFEKRIETRIKNGTMSDPNIGKEFCDYQRRVRSKTEINYRRYKDTIINSDLRGKDYHLDHKVSILFGFINNIPECVISHISNLQIIPASINLQKHTECSINIVDLMNNIKESNNE